MHPLTTEQTAVSRTNHQSAEAQVSSNEGNQKMIRTVQSTTVRFQQHRHNLCALFTLNSFSGSLEEKSIKASCFNHPTSHIHILGTVQWIAQQNFNGKGKNIMNEIKYINVIHYLYNIFHMSWISCKNASEALQIEALFTPT